MMNAVASVRTILLAILGLSSHHSLAGGPLVLEGTDGSTPVSYPGGTVSLNFDLGPFSATISNQQADDAMNQAFALWNDIATANISISQSTDLSADIDISNYDALLPSGASNDPSLDDNLSPVIYDSDGQIIDDYLYSGASADTAGFAASVYTVGSNAFVEGYAVLNGSPAMNLSTSDLVALVAHEIGHLIGLDHSQLNIDNTSTGCNGTTIRDDYPVMYPFLCRASLNLHVDDIAAASALYPSVDIDQQLGQLRGYFVDTNGQPVLGANIWVQESTRGDTYSIVSDYLKQGNGYFSLYLPAGNYTVHANSVNPIFFAASSVGPYANTSSDLSFQAPHPITEVTYQRDTGSPVAISVSAGTASEVTFRIDGTGTDSGGLSIINKPSDNTAASSGGGGTIALPMTAVLLMLIRLRQWSRPPARRLRQTA